MNYPDIFYYTSSAEQTAFQPTQPGAFNFNQFIDGEDYWEKTDFEPQQKPKTIILCDWRISAVQYQLYHPYTSILKEMMTLSEPFTVYLWQNGHFLHLNEDSLYLLYRGDIRAKIIPEENSTIVTLAEKKLNINRSALQLLNNYWGDILLNHSSDGYDSLPAHRVPLSQLLLSPHSPVRIISALIKAQPPLVALVNDVPTRAIQKKEWCRSRLERIKNEWPEIEILSDGESLLLDESERDLLSSGPLLQSKIRDLELFSSPPRIQNGAKIDLSFLSNLVSIYSQAPVELLFNLNHLRFLTLINNTLSLEFLKRIVNPSMALERISLFHCRLEEDLQEEVSFPLSNSIRSLDFDHTSMNFAFKYLIESSPHLYSITISALNACTPMLPSSVKRLTVNNPSTQELNSLLSKNPALSFLTLINGFSNSDEALRIDLSSLKYFTYIGATQIKSLIPLVPLLDKAYQLDGFSLETNAGKQTSIVARYNSAFLKQKNQSGRILAHLMNQLPFLYKEHDSGPPGEILFALESLEITLEKINMSSLENLLLKASKLKYLMIKGTQLIGSFSQKINLDSLERCELITYDLPEKEAEKFRLLSFPSVQDASFNKISSVLDYQLLNLKKLYVRSANIDELLVNLPLIPKLNFLMLGSKDSAFNNKDERLAPLLQKIKCVHFPVSYTRNAFLAPTPAFPVHDVNNYLNFRKKPDDFVFQFQNIQNSVSQQMMTDKLCQYLKITHKELQLISELNNGMCISVSALFLEYSPQEWQRRISELKLWDGSARHLKDGNLENTLEQLLLYYKRYYIEDIESSRYYIPSAMLKTVLKNNLEANGQLIVFNPWHAISLKTAPESDEWIVYDPNNPQGEEQFQIQNQAIEYIEKHLGSLLCVQDSPPRLQYTTLSTEFIKTGGLILLSWVNNYAALLPLVPKARVLDMADLNGLFLRNTLGIPAWVSCLKNPAIREYIISLLDKWNEFDPENYEARLIASMDAMSPEQQQEIHELLNGHGINTNVRGIQNTVYKQNIQEIILEKKFETWKHASPRVTSFNSYCGVLVSREDDYPKQLIQLSSGSSVLQMSLIIQEYFSSKNRPLFFVNKPRDLNCSSPGIEYHNGVGHLKKGPCGKLFDFLSTEATPVLLINYDAFNSNDMARYNSLLDENPSIDGVALPPHTLIIGLINREKPDCYQGEDFYSRLSIKESPIIPPQLFEEFMQKLDAKIKWSSNTSLEFTPINLYHMAHWKDHLLGKWILKRDQLVYQRGLLIDALMKSNRIEIQNGLWDNDEFLLFWKSIALYGYIDTPEGRFNLPQDLQICKTEGYDWPLLNESLYNSTLETVFYPNAEVLNPSRFSSFFVQYSCDNQERSLNTLPGIIEEYAYKDLHISLTRPISEHQKAQFLMQCRLHKVRLHWHEYPFYSSYAIDSSTALQSTCLIESTDVDVTLELFKQDQFHVIDITGGTASDLLTRMNADFDPEALRYAFNEMYCVLQHALAQHQNVLLKGIFSTQLIDMLAPLIINRINNPDTQEQLVLLFNQDLGSIQLPRAKHEVTEHEKYAVLMKRYSKEELDLLDKELFETDSLSQLIARLTILDAIPGCVSDSAWNGLSKLENTAFTSLVKLSSSADDSKAFFSDNLKRVNALLDKTPYVVLTGFSGTGKTTCVQQFLCRPEDTLYAEEDIIAWAMDQNPVGRKILVNDEIVQKLNYNYEGLFHKAPNILIKGELYYLTPNHKVAFTCNPLSYGGGRQLIPLFQRHGNALVFDVLPLAVIYETAIKPIFASSGLSEEKLLAIARVFLSVYQFLCRVSTDEILISPREIQMMGLLLLEKLNTDSLDYYTKFYAYHLVKESVPKAYRDAFQKAFAPSEQEEQEHRSKKRKAETDGSDFMVTETRLSCYTLIHDLLALHERRKNKTVPHATENCYGLSGLILEGSPSMGKTELLAFCLKERGYQLILNDEEAATTNKGFYKLPVSMSRNEKIELISSACKHKAVIQFDEINSAPLLVKNLNNALTGKPPIEDSGMEDSVCTIIATQNPGRIKIDNSIQRRVIHLTVPDYTRKEMEEILIQKGCDPLKAQSIIRAYTKKREYAIENNLEPIPSFREVLEVVKEKLMTGKTDAQTANKRQRIEPRHSQSRFSLFAHTTTAPDAADTDLVSSKQKRA